MLSDWLSKKENEELQIIIEDNRADVNSYYHKNYIRKFLGDLVNFIIQKVKKMILFVEQLISNKQKKVQNWLNIIKMKIKYQKKDPKNAI